MRSAATAKFLPFQYCSTIASAAEPQPSFSWCTYGTSSHNPESPAAATIETATASAPARTNCRAVFRTSSPASERFPSVHRDDDQNERHRYQQDDKQVPVVQPSGGKVVVHLCGTRGHARQVLIAHLADGPVHLPVVDPRRLQHILGLVGREHLAHG